MEWYQIAAIALGAGLLFVVVSAWVCIRMIVRARRLTGDEIRRNDTANGFGEAFEDFDLRWRREPFSLQREDALIRGELILNPNDRVSVDGVERRRVVIVCHGLTAERRAAVKYVKLFYDVGFSAVIFDERYFGASTGRCCTLGQEESKDLAALIALTRQTFGEDCILGLHGESMGAATALLALKYDSPAFVVADCPFADTRRLLRRQIRQILHVPAQPVLFVAELIARLFYGYRPELVRPMEAVAASDVPVCFMHGRSDTLIDCAHSEDMHRMQGDPRSEINLFDGAIHAYSIVTDPDGYREKLLAFLRRCEVPLRTEEHQ